MTQDKHDTLIERLEAAKSMIGNMCSQLRPPKMSIPARPDYDEDILIIGALQEAISRLKQSQWVKIEDIPEEWKDGRKVHLAFNRDAEIAYDCSFGNPCNSSDNTRAWKNDFGNEVELEITHAMLPIGIPFPPQPPKE